METGLSITFYRYSRMGDCILVFQPILWVLKYFPDVKVNFITNVEISSSFKRDLPQVNFIDYSIGRIEINKSIIRGSTNYIVDLQSNPRSILLTISLLHKFKVIRYSKNSLKRYLLVYLKGYNFKPIVSRVEQYFKCIEKILSQQSRSISSLYPFQTLKRSGDSINDRVVFALGAHHVTKKATFKVWNEVLQYNRNSKVYLVGLREDIELADRLVNSKNEESVINLVNQLDLTDLMELLSKAVHCYSNDSAVAHLAELCGTNVTVFYGPTTHRFGFAPSLTGSVVKTTSLVCSPCSTNGDKKCKFGDKRCFSSLETASI